MSPGPLMGWGYPENPSSQTTTGAIGGTKIISDEVEVYLKDNSIIVKEEKVNKSNKTHYHSLAIPFTGVLCYMVVIFIRQIVQQIIIISDNEVFLRYPYLNSLRS